MSSAAAWCCAECHPCLSASAIGTPGSTTQPLRVPVPENSCGTAGWWCCPGALQCAQGCCSQADRAIWGAAVHSWCFCWVLHHPKTCRKWGGGRHGVRKGRIEFSTGLSSSCLGAPHLLFLLPGLSHLSWLPPSCWPPLRFVTLFCKRESWDRHTHQILSMECLLVRSVKTRMSQRSSVSSHTTCSRSGRAGSEEPQFLPSLPARGFTGMSGVHICSAPSEQRHLFSGFGGFFLI